MGAIHLLKMTFLDIIDQVFRNFMHSTRLRRIKEQIFRRIKYLAMTNFIPFNEAF
jgi:hypothetical protein